VKIASKFGHSGGTGGVIVDASDYECQPIEVLTVGSLEGLYAAEEDLLVAALGTASS